MKLIGWLKSNALFAVALFLLVFIPLYPKIPLFDIVQTWVYVRLEDFLVLFANLLLAWHILRKKAHIRSPLTLPIVVYLFVVLLSMVIALLFIFPQLSGILFPHLAVLHFVRRLEYMSLFFLMYAALSRRENLRYVIYALSVSSILIVLYGLGQKLYGFPAFLTMNEEFAKGVPLRLPVTARIPSTFGGHYDLAAYLVFIIPLFGSLSVAARGLLKRTFFLCIAIGLYVLLLLTASRISLGVYLVAVSFMLVWQKKPWLILPVVIASFLLLNSVNSASERFYKTFRYSDVIVDISTGRPVGTLESLEGGTAVIKSQERPDEESLPQGSEFIGIPIKPGGSTQTIDTVEIVKTDRLRQGSGDIATVSGGFLIQKALVYDISITTRFQGQWPKAIEAFKRNIITGSGFSSLNVAVDGDYMRMLGETGIAGTIAFLGIFLYLFFWFMGIRKKMDTFPRAFVTGIMAGLVGLFLNAILIDVFEASKVAFTVWLLLGAVVAVLSTYGRPPVSYFAFLRRVFSHETAIIAYLSIAVWILYGSVFGMYFIGDDFTWLKWAASSGAGDLIKYFTESEGFFYRPIPKLWYFFLYQFFWLKPAAYHIASLALYTGIVALLYAIMRKSGIRRMIAVTLALWFSVLAVHHENVFWISGASSLLSCIFLLAAALRVITIQNQKGARRTLSVFTIHTLTLLSMLSYDGMIAAPAIIWLLMIRYFPGRLINKSQILLMLPVYLVMRSAAGALIPSGDYAVNLLKLPVNAAGNISGYLAGMAGGLGVFGYWDGFRQSLRAHIAPTALAVVVAAAIVSYAVIAFRKKLKPYAMPFMYAALSVLALSAYAGLGNITERYALFASAFLAVSVGLLTETVTRTRRTAAFAMIGAVIVSGYVNFRSLKEAETHWKTASQVSAHTVLSMKNAFFPLLSNTEFVFVDVPIRYGRAWIFPTGLDDALWHIFKFNPYWYRIYTSPSVEVALDNPRSRPAVAWYVLFFDEKLTLNRVIIEIERMNQNP